MIKVEGDVPGIMIIAFSIVTLIYLISMIAIYYHSSTKSGLVFLLSNGFSHLQHFSGSYAPRMFLSTILDAALYT